MAWRTARTRMRYVLRVCRSVRVYPLTRWAQGRGAVSHRATYQEAVDPP
jgi:hypothetical protein